MRFAASNSVKPRNDMPAKQSGNKDKDRGTTPTRRNPKASDEPQKRIPTDGADDDVRIADEEGDPRREGRPTSTDKNR